MHNTAPRHNAFAPFEPDDFWLFLDAKSIRTEHRTRGRSPGSGHSNGDRRKCSECRILALGGLLAYAGRANARGWSRAEGLAELEAHPAAYDSMVKEGRRRERPAAGHLARPYDAAFGAVYEKALTTAHAAGLLSVPVRTAQEFLGFAIQAIQDETAVIEPGQILPWEALEARMNAGPYPLPAGLRAWHLWDEIVAASDRVQREITLGGVDRANRRRPRAATMLDDHVFRQSASASCQTAPHHASADGGGDLDPIEAADEASGVGADLGADHQVTTSRVVERLVRRDVLEFAVARAETLRALTDRFGGGFGSRQDLGLVDAIARDAIGVARRDLAIADAAGELVARPDASLADAVEIVAGTLVAREVDHPYDLDTEMGRQTYERWLAAAARDACRLAQDRRHGVAAPQAAPRPTRPSTRSMAPIDTRPPELSQRRLADRDLTMETTEQNPHSYVVHGSADEAPPPGPVDLRVRWATFGKDRVQVAGDLLAELESAQADG